MGKSVRAILLVVVAMASMGVSEPRKPTARWVVNYDHAQCVRQGDTGTVAVAC